MTCGKKNTGFEVFENIQRVGWYLIKIDIYQFMMRKNALDLEALSDDCIYLGLDLAQDLPDMGD